MSRTLPRRRTRRRNNRDMSVTPRGRRRLIQLLLCSGLFVLLVFAKLFLPDGLADFRSKAAALLQWNMDFRSAFASIGRAVSGEESLKDAIDDVYVSVFNPSGAVETAAIEAQQGSVVDTLQYSLENGESLAAMLLPLAEATPVSAVTAQTLQPQTYVYTQENLPENVSMNQKILGISYTAPAQGRFTSGFGYRMHPIYEKELFHYGIDIANDSGTDICAFADGSVKAVGESSLMGQYLIVSHDNGVETLYAHCSKILAATGASVQKGEKIACMGSSGLSTGSHLHFEIHLNGVYLNPIYYVDLHA